MALSDYLVPAGANTNICFDCRKACGLCSWSERFEPVPGWTAKPTVIRTNCGFGLVETATYHITACPEFVKDEPRKSECGEITLEQLRTMIARGKM